MSSVVHKGNKKKVTANTLAITFTFPRLFTKSIYPVDLYKDNIFLQTFCGLARKFFPSSQNNIAVVRV